MGRIICAQEGALVRWVMGVGCDAHVRELSDGAVKELGLRYGPDNAGYRQRS